MAAKESIKQVEELFISKKKGDVVTFENISKEFDKQITVSQAKKILQYSKKYHVSMVSASEYAKHLSIQEGKRREKARKKMAENNSEEQFDFTKEKELLEWSRSDSPVRMYLREMGKIPLLTKEEEVYLSKQIEEGEDVIIDAICSVPYLIDYIINYREPLLNRERRVKELFKNFEDVSNKDEREDSEEKAGTAASPKDDKRVKQVVDSFKLLEKNKKEWMRERDELLKLQETDTDEP
ncbi:MAG: RNA polymerase sigma factor RpoD, partial [Epsilonproteobacteria bacterium]